MSDRKAAGYYKSFVNFVGQNPESESKNKDVGDDDDDAAKSSDDTAKQDHSDRTPISRPNTAKRGRLRGPKCARERLAKKNSDASSSSALASENEKESEDDAAHVRSARTARQKGVQKGRSKKAAKTRNDSESSDHSMEEQDDDYEDFDDEKSSNYDSDEDPAWRPKKKKNSIGGGSAKKRAASSESDDDEYRPKRGRPPTRGRGRAVRGKGRGIVTAAKPVGSKESPSQSPLPASSASREIERVEPRVEPAVVSTAPRPVGRPPTVAVVNAIQPVPMTDSYIPDLNPPHNCQKGDFIIDRRDANNCTTYAIWRIDSQRLLQKFEAFEKDGRLLHRALCTYSSWPVHSQHNYSAISVRYISCTRGKEIVEVQEKYRPRPLGVQGAELDALREAFTIYTQILLSQALEPTFIGALIDEPDEYYTVPSERIEKVLLVRIKNVGKLYPWNTDFLNDLKKFHSFTLIDCPDGTSWSKATSSRNEQAKKCVRFHGHIYNQETLETIIEVSENDGPEYPLTASESIVLTVLHSLHHLKFKLCRVCQTRVDELREAKPDVDDHSVLDTCLRDQPWMQQLFARLTTLLENADRIAGR